MKLLLYEVFALGWRSASALRLRQPEIGGFSRWGAANTSRAEALVASERRYRNAEALPPKGKVTHQL
jgi:hypothetical protein